MMEHKSIFLKLKDYRSNPITEYTKINTYLNETSAHYLQSIMKELSEVFINTKQLATFYVDINDCLSKNIYTLRKYGNHNYDSLPNDLKEIIFDEFLTYCEIILYLYHRLVRRVGSNVGGYYYTDNINRGLDIINASLKSINYCYSVDSSNGGEIRIKKTNSEAEAVAKESPMNLRMAIESYLAIRDSDIEGKTNTLHVIIDLLEPTFTKYGNQQLVGKTREYAQLLRHPEINKEKEEYKWFYMDKGKYLDKLFNLCIFVQQYVLANDVVNEFNENKNHN